MTGQLYDSGKNSLRGFAKFCGALDFSCQSFFSPYVCSWDSLGLPPPDFKPK